jgi:hypothetical protein
LAGLSTLFAAVASPANMSWSKLTVMNGNGSGTIASAGGLVATTDGANTGFSTSTWFD